MASRRCPRSRPGGRRRAPDASGTGTAWVDRCGGGCGYGQCRCPASAPAGRHGCRAARSPALVATAGGKLASRRSLLKIVTLPSPCRGPKWSPAADAGGAGSVGRRALAGPADTARECRCGASTAGRPSRARLPRAPGQRSRRVPRRAPRNGRRALPRGVVLSQDSPRAGSTTRPAGVAAGAPLA
jgi:hypothetical protein